MTALEGVANFHTLRQRLREWLYDGADKAAPCHTQVDVSACCAGLVHWLVSLWSDEQIVLALDATGHRDALTVLAISVLYRGSAIPLCWRVLPGNQKGAWNPHWLAMLSWLQSLLPACWQVLVLCDRGLWSPLLYRAICAQGWHPLMRVRTNSVFTPTGRCCLPARCLLGQPGQAWVGAGKAFAAPKQLPATLIAVWLSQEHEMCLVVTNLPPTQAGIAWYGLRMWIEAGFRLVKSAGWQWQNTRRTDCERAARHWLVLAIATLWTLCYGTRCEDSQAFPASPLRVVSVFRRGLMALQRQLHRQRLWKRLWLCAQPLPLPPQHLQIVLDYPPDTG